MDEKYTLTNLRDIVVPDPPPLWPPAPEVWLLFAIAAAVFSLLFYQWRRARQRNAYRRAGLALLDGTSTVRDVSVVLKRVALAAFPRERVASLYGEDWSTFLHDTCARHDFSMIGTADPGTKADPTLFHLAESWIRKHRVPEHQASVGGQA